MKVLCVCEMGHGATSAMRVDGLEALGHTIRRINSAPKLPENTVSKFAARVFWKLGWPVDHAGLNQKLVHSVQEDLPDLIWVDKGIYIDAKTLADIRKLAPQTKLVHYNPDDPFGKFGKSGWRKFISTIKHYDVHFVPRQENVSEYKAHGAGTIFHSIPTRGFASDVHRPWPVEEPFKSQFAASVGFLGAYEKERSKSLQRLAGSGVDVRLMFDWPDRHWHPRFLRAPRSVRGVEYAKALSCFKIALGFLRKGNRDKHCSRSIEIPACGTFMLAERTDDHLQLFKEGVEAEFFDSDDELVDKARYYLANDAARERIARAGRERCLKSGYDYESRMKDMLAKACGSDS